MVHPQKLTRRELIKLLGMGVAGAALAACSQPAPPSAPEPTQPPGPGPAEQPSLLRVWITWGDNPAQLQSLFNRYGEANNVRIEVNAPVEDDKVIAALSGNEPPDVLVLSGPDSVGTWQREKLLLPLDDIVAANDIDLNDIFPAPLSLCTFGGKYYALPWGTDTYALFWNKDLFEDADLDPDQPPETIEELDALAEKATIVKDGEVTQVGFIPDFSWSHLDLYLKMFGGSIFSEDLTQVHLNTPEMVECLKWQQRFYTRYGAENILQFMTALGGYMSPDHGFYAAKVAMMVEGEWQPGPNFIGKYKPELYYGVAPFPHPQAHPERKNTNVVGGTVATVPSGVRSVEASGHLLAWMMSPEIVAEEMYVNYNLPTSRKAAEDPRFHENDKFEVFLRLMADPNATISPVTVIGAEVNTELGQIEEQVLHAGADPEPLLRAADEKLQPLLEKALAEG